jgi:hypothetical protein
MWNFTQNGLKKVEYNERQKLETFTLADSSYQTWNKGRNLEWVYLIQQLDEKWRRILTFY